MSIESQYNELQTKYFLINREVQRYKDLDQNYQKETTALKNDIKMYKELLIQAQAEIEACHALREQTKELESATEIQKKKVQVCQEENKKTEQKLQEQIQIAKQLEESKQKLKDDYQARIIKLQKDQDLAIADLKQELAIAYAQQLDIHVKKYNGLQQQFQDQIISLKQVIQKQETELISLTNQNQALNDRILELLKGNNNLNQQCLNLQSQIQTANATIDSMQKDNEKNQAEMNKRAMFQQANIDQMVIVNNQLRATVDHVNQKRKIELAEVTKNLEQQREKEILLYQNAILKMEQDIEQQLKLQQQNFDEQVQLCDKLKRETVQKTLEYDQLAKKYVQASNEINNKTEELKNEKQTGLMREKQIQTLLNKINELEVQQNLLIEEQSHGNEEFQKSRNEVVSLYGKIKEANTRLAEQLQSINIKDHDIYVLKQHIASDREVIIRQQQQIMELQKNVPQNFENELNKLHQTIQLQKKQIDTLLIQSDQEHKNYQKDIERLTRDLQMWQVNQLEQQKLNEPINIQNNTNSEFQSQIMDDDDSERNNLREQINQLNRELKLCRENYEDQI